MPASGLLSNFSAQTTTGPQAVNANPVVVETCTPLRIDHRMAQVVAACLASLFHGAANSLQMHSMAQVPPVALVSLAASFENTASAEDSGLHSMFLEEVLQAAEGQPGRSMSIDRGQHPFSLRLLHNL